MLEESKTQFKKKMVPMDTKVTMKTKKILGLEGKI